MKAQMSWSGRYQILQIPYAQAREAEEALADGIAQWLREQCPECEGTGFACGFDDEFPCETCDAI